MGKPKCYAHDLRLYVREGSVCSVCSVLVKKIVLGYICANNYIDRSVRYSYGLFLLNQLEKISDLRRTCFFSLSTSILPSCLASFRSVNDF